MPLIRLHGYRCSAVSNLQAVLLSGNPDTMQAISQCPLPMRVYLAPPLISPLCCRKRRAGSTVLPTYVRRVRRRFRRTYTNHGFVLISVGLLFVFFFASSFLFFLFGVFFCGRARSYANRLRKRLRRKGYRYLLLPPPQPNRARSHCSVTQSSSLHSRISPRSSMHAGRPLQTWRDMS